MPELPEVESIVRSLDKKISGKKIYRISVLRKNILQLSQKKFSTILLQQKIQRVFRYGKYIIFELENLYLWVVHLRMSGKFIYPAQKKPALHDRVLFELDDKTLLSYNDVRCFGTMELLEKRLVFSEIKKLGLDALDSGWTKENFLLSQIRTPQKRTVFFVPQQPKKKYNTKKHYNIFRHSSHAYK